MFNIGTSIDERGVVTFANDFNFKGVKRFYIVSNHTPDTIRAWHGHKKEAKYVFALKGTILLGMVPMDGGSVETYILDKNSQIVHIPPGYYNGFKTLTDDAQVMFFSTSTVEESLNDDYRKPADTWDIW